MRMVERTTVTVENMFDTVKLAMIEEGSMFLLDGELYAVADNLKCNQPDILIINLTSGGLERCDLNERVTPIKSIIVTPYTREEIKELQDE